MNDPASVQALLELLNVIVSAPENPALRQAEPALRILFREIERQLALPLLSPHIDTPDPGDLVPVGVAFDVTLDTSGSDPAVEHELLVLNTSTPPDLVLGPISVPDPTEPTSITLGDAEAGQKLYLEIGIPAGVAGADDQQRHRISVRAANTFIATATADKSGMIAQGDKVTFEMDFSGGGAPYEYTITIDENPPVVLAKNNIVTTPVTAFHVFGTLGQFKASFDLSDKFDSPISSPPDDIDFDVQ